MAQKTSSVIRFIFIVVIILLYWFGFDNLSKDGESKDSEDRIKDIESEVDKLKRHALLIIPVLQTLFFKK